MVLTGPRPEGMSWQPCPSPRPLGALLLLVPEPVWPGAHACHGLRHLQQPMVSARLCAFLPGAAG